jgi:negative regulator of sigma-B (phosphoserine phosphatase)
VETIVNPWVNCGIATFVLPGEELSGDHAFVSPSEAGALIAVIDGIGHGEEAANAANTAIGILGRGINRPIISVVGECHEALRASRGVVLSVASVDMPNGMMTWLGVGNVQGVLMRGMSKPGNGREMLLLRSGVVGAQLPPLQAAVLPVAPGDTLFFATDGIRSEFVESLSAQENPQRAAQRILEKYRTGSDDALALAVRLTGKPK